MNLIVAVDDNWGIGKNGTQTVIIPEDRRRFRELTDGGTIIVGHRTLLDFPDKKPLPGRLNIVMTRNRDLKIPGAVVVTSLEELFMLVAGTNHNKIFVIGGDSVFKMLLPYCTYAYVTKIKAAPESDAYFPNLDKLGNWAVDETGAAKVHDGVEYTFLRYINKSPLEYK